MEVAPLMGRAPVFVTLVDDPHQGEVDALLKRFDVSQEAGLSKEQSRARRAVEGANTVPLPHSCPAWLCCILPCILSSRSMVLFQECIPGDAYVRRDGSWIRMDAGSMVRGDIVRLRRGDRAAADVRLIKVMPEFKFEAVWITGDGADRLGAVQATDPDPVHSNNIVPLSALVLDGEAVGVVVGAGAGSLIGQLVRAGRWPPKHMKV